jgi:hypothetical protein
MNGRRDQSFSPTGSAPSAQKHNATSGPLCAEGKSKVIRISNHTSAGKNDKEYFGLQTCYVNTARDGTRVEGIMYGDLRLKASLPGMVEVNNQDNGVLGSAGAYHRNKRIMP